MSKFTRRHYQEFADYAAKRRNGPLKWDVCNFFARHFRDDNPRFNKDRFLEACGFPNNDRPKPKPMSKGREDTLRVAADVLEEAGYCEVAELLNSAADDIDLLEWFGR